jgi:hypothetical protein
MGNDLMPAQAQVNRHARKLSVTNPGQTKRAGASEAEGFLDSAQNKLNCDCRQDQPHDSSQNSDSSLAKPPQ